MSKIILSLSTLLACVISVSAQKINVVSLSTDPHSVTAVSQLTDQTELLNIALEEKSWAVRLAVLNKLTNQAFLAKFAVEDKGEDQQFRNMAVCKLTDQALLMKFALEGKDWGIRYSAVSTLTNQSLLTKIAVDGKEPEFREIALSKLTDQGLLAKIVVNNEGNSIQAAAIKNLTNQSLLVKCITNTDMPLLARHMAFCKLKGVNIDSKKLAGNLHAATHDAIEAMGRIQLALENPILNSHMSTITLDASAEIIQHSYYGFARGVDVLGERVAFTLKRRSDVLASQQWVTLFPSGIASSDSRFRKAAVDVSELMSKLFKLGGLSQENLLKLSRSEMPEMRAGAAAILQDQTIWAEEAQDKQQSWEARKTATDKLTDQTVLAKVALQDEEIDVRVAAVEKVTDQELLAKIAVVHSSFNILPDGKIFSAWSTATEQLTNQTLLAKIAVEADNDDVRRLAVKKLTDQAVLEKIAIDDKAGGSRPDSFHLVGGVWASSNNAAIRVRNVAVTMLTNQTVLAKIAVDDNIGSVREAAKKRLAELKAGKP